MENVKWKKENGKWQIENWNNGNVKFKIPSGIKNGQVLRLKNKGFKEVNRYKTGDQYIKITIDIPQNISKSLKNKILDLKEDLQYDVKFKKINN